MKPAKYFYIDEYLFSKIDANYCNVIFINERFFTKVNRYIYFKIKDFTIAKRTVRDNPDLRFEDKKRIKII